MSLYKQPELTAAERAVLATEASINNLVSVLLTEIGRIKANIWENPEVSPEDYFLSAGISGKSQVEDGIALLNFIEQIFIRHGEALPTEVVAFRTPPREFVINEDGTVTVVPLPVAEEELSPVEETPVEETPVEEVAP